MTRINTNVSSLLAQNALANSNNELQTSLTRLSTGLRINSGADDPAGLIASTALQADMTGINSAISNSNLADEMISTADSALGQVSTLLNNIQGLVTQAASTGTESSSQISAAQLQIDSSLNAIDRISQTTNFQGQNLLDGSLDFNVSKGVGADSSNLKSLTISQADLGVNGSLSVTADITSAAAQAQLTALVPGATTNTGNTPATATINLAYGNITIESPLNSSGQNTDADNGVAIKFLESANVAAGNPTASYDAANRTVDINVNSAGNTTLANIETAVQGLGFRVTAANGNFDPLVDSPNAVAAKDAAATITTSDGGQLQITSSLPGTAANVDKVAFATSSSQAVGTASADFNTGNNTLTITVNSGSGNSTSLGNIATAIDNATVNGNSAGTANFGALELQTGNFTVGNDASGSTAGNPAVITDPLASGNGALLFTSTGDTNLYNNANITIVESACTTLVSGNAAVATWNSSGNGSLTITVASAGNATIANIEQAVNSGNGPFRVTEVAYGNNTNLDTSIVNGNDALGTALTATGNGVVGVPTGLNTQLSGGAAAITGVDATLTGGANPGGGLINDVTFQVTGNSGSQVFSFAAGTDIDTIVKAINNSSDATGVTASSGGQSATNPSDNTLQLNSSGYGSSQFVSINVINEGGDGTQFTNSLSGSRATGTDIQGSINGVTATGDGNTLSIDTASLSTSLTVADGSNTSVNFNITGGGALFQIGATVNSSNQARLGIQSVGTDALGGTSGLMYQLASGGTASLGSSPTLAGQITTEAINQVSSVRGQLGAFQSTTLQSNISTLTDALQNLTAANSNITDADFAAESANLTRAQILVQSGTAVLSVANKNPQNVLSLLQGL